MRPRRSAMPWALATRHAAQFETPDVAHQPLAHQLVERLDRLLDRGDRVGAVDLVEVDMVELQPLQARLDRVEQVPARGAGAVRAGRRCGRSALVAITTSSRGDAEVARSPGR